MPELIQQSTTDKQLAARPSIPWWRWLQVALLGWLCLKVAGCVMLVPGPWGPRVGGRLPNGNEIYFQARKVGGETDDRLIWVTPAGTSRHYWVDQIHAGFDQVTVKYMHGGDRVWIESNGKVGASIDLTTGDFRAERQQQHSWAVFGEGEALASGSTGTVLSILGPW